MKELRKEKKITESTAILNFISLFHNIVAIENILTLWLRFYIARTAIKWQIKVEMEMIMERAWKMFMTSFRFFIYIVLTTHLRSRFNWAKLKFWIMRNPSKIFLNIPQKLYFHTIYILSSFTSFFMYKK